MEDFNASDASNNLFHSEQEKKHKTAVSKLTEMVRANQSSEITTLRATLTELERQNKRLRSDQSDLETQYATQSAELSAAKEEIKRLSENCRDAAAQAETDAGIIESDGKEIHYLRQQVAARDLVIKQMHDIMSGTVDEVWKSCSHQHASEFSEKLRRLQPSTESLDAYVKQAVDAALAVAKDKGN